MAGKLEGRRVAFLVANEGVEQIELTSPWEVVEREGGEPVLIAPEVGQVRAFHHLDRGDDFEATVAAADAVAADYAGLVLPGGVANPDALRTDDAAVELIRGCFGAGVPVAVICHGPWPLIDAEVVAGRRITSWPSLRTDLRNAGAEWVDAEVVVCSDGPNRLVSSRRPDDLPAFEEALIDQFTSADPG